MAVIPDVPEEIDIQLDRTDFITRKLIDKVADDDDEDVEGTQAELEIKEYPDFGGVYAHDVEPPPDSVQLYKWRSL